MLANGRFCKLLQSLEDDSGAWLLEEYYINQNTLGEISAATGLTRDEVAEIHNESLSSLLDHLMPLVESDSFWTRVEPRLDLRRPVKNLETGVEFPSVSEAAKSVGAYPMSICTAAKKGARCAGFHWAYTKPKPPAPRVPVHMKTCTADGCQNKQAARGWCHHHYHAKQKEALRPAKELAQAIERLRELRSEIDGLAGEEDLLIEKIADLSASTAPPSTSPAHPSK